jgi:predicted signal transduction protein with EAL and GGDEF domain
VRLALDDFGTGYASFSYFRRFPIDILKIDRSFVAGMGQHLDDDAIVGSIVSLARRTGKTVVAEGVETRAQADALRALGVPLAQGYLWTAPLPCEQVLSWSGATESGRLGELIRQMHAEGASLHTIAAALNGTGSRSPQGARWHIRSIAKILVDTRGARALA